MGGKVCPKHVGASPGKSYNAIFSLRAFDAGSLKYLSRRDQCLLK